MTTIVTMALAWTVALLAMQPARGESVPSALLRYREFTMRFAPDGSFELQGTGYPTFKGSWKPQAEGEVEIVAPNQRGGCPEPARYRVRRDRQWTILEAVTDPCAGRQFFLGVRFVY